MFVCVYYTHKQTLVQRVLKHIGMRKLHLQLLGNMSMSDSCWVRSLLTTSLASRASWAALPGGSPPGHRGQEQDEHLWPGSPWRALYRGEHGRASAPPRPRGSCNIPICFLCLCGDPLPLPLPLDDFFSTISIRLLLRCFSE